MIESHIENRLRAALNEYTGVVPLPDRHHLGQAMFTTEGMAVDGIPPRRRRFTTSRLVAVLVTAIGLAGTATGLAAAAGAFDGSARHAAVESFKESFIDNLRSTPAGPIRAELRSVARTFRPRDLVLRATSYGPQHSTFTVWTYSNRSKAPWCYILVQAVSGHTARPLGGGCQFNGVDLDNAGGYSEWPCTPGPHDRGVAGPEYFVIASQVPRGVTKVIVHGTSSEGWEARVAHGWFILTASDTIHWPTPVTYVGPGKATSTGTLNIGGGTC